MSADVLCCGIVVADHVCNPIDHLPAAGELVMSEKMLLTIGGCAANAAVDLVKMGVNAEVVGRVGDDIFGRVVSDLLRDHGVDVSGLKVTPGCDTSQTLIVNVQGEDRRFIHTFGANRMFRAADIPAAAIARSKILYLGGYLVMDSVTQEELVPVFASARQQGVKTVLDVVTPGQADYLPRFEKLLPHVDVFLPNDHEAGLISKKADPLEQAELFRQLGAGTVVVTSGGQGALLVSKDLKLRSGVYPVNYVDGSGGGDAFDAGFIFGMLNDLGPEDCLRYASALGASCVRAIGTTPGVFTRAECEAFVAKHQLPIARM
ncbi:MAG: carbohydrate kinase family protein [Gemmataceae bacterium]